MELEYFFGFARKGGFDWWPWRFCRQEGITKLNLT